MFVQGRDGAPIGMNGTYETSRQAWAKARNDISCALAACDVDRALHAAVHVLETHPQITFTDFPILNDLAAAVLNEDPLDVTSPQSDGDVLEKLGRRLLRIGLPHAAASVLQRAVAAKPDEQTTVEALVWALYRAGARDAIADVVRDASGTLATSFPVKYLHALTAVLRGDLGTARALLPDLRRTPILQEQRLAERVEAMVARADAVSGTIPLDSTDLRGWHFVITGALLMERSTIEVETMQGRYALTQDSFERCSEGTQYVRAILDEIGLVPARVLAAPDAHSRILAQAAATLLDRPLALWSPADDGEDALVVCYDIALTKPEFVEAMVGHARRQVLWVQMTRWTDDQPLVGDLTTYEAQSNVPPWSTETSPESVTDLAWVEEQAEHILHAGVSAADLVELPDLRRIITAAGTLPESKGLAASRSSGVRSQLWDTSPVLSSRFDY
jgi:Flp pilus assembly protein TadD